MDGFKAEQVETSVGDVEVKTTEEATADEQVPAEQQIQYTVTSEGELLTIPTDGAGQLLNNDFEALATIQEELDRITGDQGEEGQVTHAMITADGTAVPLQVNPETGEYMTASGERVVTTEIDGQQVVVQASDAGAEETVIPDTSDLSSLAAAAEAHAGVEQIHEHTESIEEMDTSEHQVVSMDTGHDQMIVESEGGQIQLDQIGDLAEEEILSTQMVEEDASTISIVNEDGTIQNQTIRVVKHEQPQPQTTTIGGQQYRIVTSVPQQIEQPQIKLVSQASTNQTIRILNADGTLSALNQDIRILNPDGTISLPISSAAPQQQQVQQVRIVNADGSVSIGSAVSTSAAGTQIRIPISSAPQQQSQIRIQNEAITTSASPQQIRILNSDGTYTNLSGNIKIVSGGQQQQGKQQIRVIRAGTSSGPSSPTKAITLSQAQQMGLLSPSRTTKLLKASPTKAVTKPSSPQRQQVLIRSASGGGQQQIVQAKQGTVLQSSSGQILRIPVSQASNLGSLQQVQIGNKVQYVRVIGSSQGQQGSMGTKQAQIVTVRGGTPILPSTVKTGGAIPVAIKGTQGGVVKIALPQRRSSQGLKSVAPKTFTPQNRVILPSGQIKSNAAGQAQPQQKQQQQGGGGNSFNMYEAFLNRKEERKQPTNTVPIEPQGVRPRKPCNCTKSQCLKLYCDCFANGEFCFNCNCTNCYNNLAHEEERQKSIKQCLDRNPNAFRPKIGKASGEGERRHNKGCNCKRSGCLKNYCECYEAKIPCTDSCKCLGCKNVEESTGRKKETHTKHVETFKPSLKSKLAPLTNNNAFKPAVGVKQPFTFVTPEVVEATCQCLLAQAEEAERNSLPEVEIEKLILEEFGRCLSQIIDFSNKTKPGTAEST